MFTTYLLFATAFSAGKAFSQSSTTAVPAARIVEKIDDSRLVALKGNTVPAANPQNDLGPVAPSLQMTDLILVLSRSETQQAAFDEFVAGEYDASSPDFHRWLDPAEVGEKFGPSPTDIATISEWLASHGFSVDEVSKDRLSIRFSGTAAQVQNAFHTEIHKLSVRGERHIANMSDPQIPEALSPVIVGIKALHDFRPRPLHRMGSKVELNSQTGSWERIGDAGSAFVAPIVSAQAGSPQPDYGIPISSGNNYYLIEDIAPYDFATIYNVLPLWNSNIDGSGQTIAIAGTSDINTADVASFRQVFGLPAGTTPTTIVANGVDPGQCAGSGACSIDDQVENTLDVEWAGAVAKGANITLVVSGQTSVLTDTVYSSANYVVQNNTAKILNVSYGLCELFEGSAGNAAYNNLWESAAAEGIAVFVASGDSGSPACDQGLSSTAPYGAAYGLSVSGLASTPYNTAVGGTDFNWCKPTVGSNGYVTGCGRAAPYWTTNSGTGASATGYVPEVPWNDSCASTAATTYLRSLGTFLSISGVTDPETACNFVINHYQSIYNQYQVNLSGFVYPIGGGGGASNCTASDGSTVASCTGGYAKPAWQTGVPGILSDGKRDIPDVSFFASNGFLNSAYLICVSATGACVTSTTLNSEPLGEEVGGTSVSSPAMAGVMALINQKAGTPQGSPNAELYKLGARQTYASCSAETGTVSNGCYFNDIDTGTIAMPCLSGALNCVVSHTGDTWGLLSGYGAASGFDAATGLGSLNVANVVDGWTSTLGTATSTVTVTPAQNTLLLSDSLSVTVTVNGGSGTPTGTVALVGGGYTATAGTLASGSTTIVIPAESLKPGSDTLTASYSGDSTFAEATGTATVTVNKLTPTVAVQANPSTIGANTQVNVSVKVNGAGPTPTGTVQLTGGGYTSPNCTLGSDGACTINIPQNTLASGTDVLTVNYRGDSVYLAGSGSTSVTNNALTPTITVTPSLTSLDTVTALSVKVTVTGSGPTPTGTFFLYGLYGGNPSNGYALSGTLSGGSTTLTVNPGMLYPGTVTLTAVYSGDANYIPQNGAASVTVTKATPVMTVAPSATSITSNLPLTLSGTITSPAENPAGESLTITGGGYSGYGYAIGDGTYSVQIPGGKLSVGADTLTVAYPGDTLFNPVSASTTVNVTPWVLAPSSITATPESSTIYTGQSLTIDFSVTGAYGLPTGTVTATSGGTVVGHAYATDGRVWIPNGTLSAGTLTIAVNYSGDPTYLPSSTTTTVTVIQSEYSLSASPATPVSAGQTTNSLVTASSNTGYDGIITLTCSLTGQPSGAVHVPTCQPLSQLSLYAYETTSMVEMEIYTTAPTKSAVSLPKPVRGRALKAAGEAVLAVLVLVGIPAHRRRWRSLLGALVLLMALYGVGACGGGGGSSGGSGGSGGTIPGTTAGTYTFTVTGNGNPAVTPAPSTTFTVTVN